MKQQNTWCILLWITWKQMQCCSRHLLLSLKTIYICLWLSVCISSLLVNMLLIFTVMDIFWGRVHLLKLTMESPVKYIVLTMNLDVRKFIMFASITSRRHHRNITRKESSDGDLVVFLQSLLSPLQHQPHLMRPCLTLARHLTPASPPSPLHHRALPLSQASTNCQHVLWAS